MYIFSNKLKLRLIKLPAVTVFQCRRHLSEYKSHYRLFLKYFDFQQSEANLYIQGNRLQRVEPETLEKSIQFCFEIGFNKPGILRYPTLLRTHPITLEQQYLMMTEGSFDKITPHAMSKFRTFMKQLISTLKNIDLIPKKANVVESYISHLNPRPKNFKLTKIDKNDSWGHLHTAILTEYLKWRLQATDSQIQTLIRIHPGVCHKSFRFLCENIAIAEDLGFAPHKMLKYGYILHAYPKYTKTNLEQHAQLAGTSMKRAMRMYPKLITISPESIDKIYSILKEFNIPDATIVKQMNVFQLSPKTVRLRLEELQKIADLKVLMHNPNILKLVVHHNRARSRFQFLKELQMRCTSVTVLGADDTNFKNFVDHQIDTNTSVDVMNFLQALTNVEMSRFKACLRRHPRYLEVPLVVMEDSFNYLVDVAGFAIDDIVDVIYILLYPKEKIMEGIKQVDLFQKDNKRRLAGNIRLNLIVYYIEKFSSFDGSSVLNENQCVEKDHNN